MPAKSRLRQIVLLSACTLGTAYFAYHAYAGRHGMALRWQLTTALTQAELKLQEYQIVKAALQRDVALLQSERLDPDLLDETARGLGFAHPDDLIVLQR